MSNREPELHRASATGSRQTSRSRLVIEAGAATEHGPRLLIGAICLVAIATLGGRLVAGSHNDGMLSGLDISVTNAFVRHRPSWLISASKAISALGDVVEMVVMSVAAALLAWRRRLGSLWLLPLVATVGASLLAQIVKLTVGRSRPPVALRLTHETNYSMPSGHTTTAAAALGALAVVIALVAPRWRRWAAGGAVALTTLIALSRLVLGVHWLSDVMLGAALGAAWLAVSFTIWSPRRALTDLAKGSSVDSSDAPTEPSPESSGLA
ncbi:MAG: phosphatase PAP2 family protein [Actinomycetota bacterium]|nr:phosphatase PAP2 family protein [Actinomycetota bacterium]